MPTPLSVSDARFALITRLTTFLSTPWPAPGSDSLQHLVKVFNDLQPLFASYEAAVIHETLRDVSDDIWREVTDQTATLITAEPDATDSGIVITTRVIAYQDVHDWAMRRRAQGQRKNG